MNKKQKQAGFSLIELMVSLSLFIIVVLAAVSSLYSVNNASRKIESMRNVLDNLNFAMESMSRTIRTGNSISCSTTIPNSDCALGTVGSSQISLTSTLGANPQVIQYEYVKQNGIGQIQKVVGSSRFSITSPDINITKFQIYVDGANPNDNVQPNVTLFVEGIAKAGTDNTVPFAIQTYVSQRALE